jgi:hypothetical protein
MRDLVKIEFDEIVIRIPIEGIANAAKVTFDGCYAYEDHGLKVTDESLFAHALVNVLKQEDDKGRTRVHYMLDDACVEVSDKDGGGLSEDI